MYMYILFIRKKKSIAYIANKGISTSKKIMNLKNPIYKKKF